jgi:hypothetical protein
VAAVRAGERRERHARRLLRPGRAHGCDR